MKTCAGSTFDGVEAAADHLSHAIALEPRFWPALVEKARLWAAIGDWDQVKRTAFGKPLGFLHLPAENPWGFHLGMRKSALKMMGRTAGCVMTGRGQTVGPTKRRCFYYFPIFLFASL